MNVRNLALASALALLSACGGDEETDSSGGSSGGGGSSSSGSAAGGSSSGAAATLTVIDGIEIPVSIEICAENLFPNVSKSDITFNWTAHAGANQYAVRARKGPNDTNYVETFAGVQAATTYAYGERVAETSYVIDVYALSDRTPLCTYSGANGVTPH